MFKNTELCYTCLSINRKLTPTELYSSFFESVNLREIQPGNGICWECRRIIIKFSKFILQVQSVQTILNQKLHTIQPQSKLSNQIKNKYDYEFYHNYHTVLAVEASSIEKDFKQEVLNDKIEVQSSESNDNLAKFSTNKCLLDKDTAFMEPTVTKNDTDIEDCISINDVHEYDDAINVLNENAFSNIEEKKDNMRIRSKRRDLIKFKRRINKNNVNFSIAIDEKCINKTNVHQKIVDEKLVKNSQQDFEEKYIKVIFTEMEMIKNREGKRNHPNFKKIPYKCDTCVLGFTRKENYDLHIVKKHDVNIGPYSCSVCEIKFRSQSSMERHKVKHYCVYRCKLCRYETFELWSAVNHCKEKHSGDTAGRIHCAQCLNVFKTPEELAEHSRTEHTIICNECGEKFKGQNTLRSHKTRIHAVKREFSCEMCRRRFKSESRLESHMAGHEPSAARRLAYCAPCRVQYKNIYVYRNHLRNSANHTERAYPCPECDKKFASKVYWTKHYNFYHLHKSQYKCDVCNKLFISACRLKNHNQKYHGLLRTRDHACNVCGKKFYTVSTLRAHILTHSEQRTYMCEDCGDTFKQRPSLYTHTRLVHRGGRKKAES